MPAPPKKIEELLSNFSYEEITPQILSYYKHSTTRENIPIAFYDPLYRKVYVQPEVIKDPEKLKKVLLHEYTHEVTSDVTKEEFLQIYQDIKKLGIMDPERMRNILKYPEEDRARELLARFAEVFPNEILHPITPTGRILNSAFATKYNWDKMPTSLIEELKKHFANINKDNILSESKNIAKIFTERFKNYVNNSIRLTYIKSKNTILKKEGKEMDYDISDESLINNYTQNKQLWEAYTNLDDTMVRKVNSILSSSFENQTFNPNEAKKRILKEVPKLTENRVNSIIRTEYANIRNLATEKTYKDIDPENKNRYIMLGPMDNRTADSTKEVHYRQGQGMPLEELKTLIKEVSTKYHPDTYTEQRPFLIHINSRRILHKVS